MKTSEIRICPICQCKMIVKDLSYVRDPHLGDIIRIERQQWCGCGYRGQPFTFTNPGIEDKLMNSWLSINKLNLKDK